jgi:hypothetical protein
MERARNRRLLPGSLRQKFFLVYLLINMISLASHKGIWQELPIILPANPPNLPTYYIVLVRLKKWAV